jgi:hypothetical protein
LREGKTIDQKRSTSMKYFSSEETVMAFKKDVIYATIFNHINTIAIIDFRNYMKWRA